jgi:hypothetical protein
MQLRYLTTLNSISTDRTNTIVFPFPMDLLRNMAGGSGEPPAGAAGR